MISLCLGSALHQERLDTFMTVREGAYMLYKSSPVQLGMWRYSKRVSRWSNLVCGGIANEWAGVCGATLDGVMIHTTQGSVILAGYCMSYDDSQRQSLEDAHSTIYTTILMLRVYTSKLNSFICNTWFELSWPVLQSLSGRTRDKYSFLQSAVCIKCFGKHYGWLLWITATSTILCNSASSWHVQEH